jgi:ankyrin repeat protein
VQSRLPVVVDEIFALASFMLQRAGNHVTRLQRFTMKQRRHVLWYENDQKHSDGIDWKGRNSSRFDDIGRHADVVVRLLDYGADVNAVDVKGQTALYMAVKYELVDFVKLMLDGRRADPNRTTSGRYPLNVACAKGNTSLIEMLLEAGANPN